MRVKIITLLSILLMVLLAGCTKKEYTVIFADWNDIIIQEEVLPEGATIIPPSDPVRTGFVFTGWDEEFDVANRNIVIKALYEQAEFTVVFQGTNQTILKEEAVYYGQSATAPTVTPPEGYNFAGWNQTFDEVTTDLIVIAQFEKKMLTVRFYDDQGTLLKEEQVEYGTNAHPPVVEDRADEEFDSWDAATTNITANTDINAVFVEKEYTIAFYDGATKLSLGISTYKKSDNLVFPAPTKTGYAFAGWFLSPISLYEVTSVTADISGNINLYSRWVKTAVGELVAPTGAIEFESINKNPHSSGVGFVYQPKFPTGAPTTSVTAYNWASANTQVATISTYSSISNVSAGYAIITGTLKADSNVVYYCVAKTSADGIVKSSIEEANAPNFVTATFVMEGSTPITKIVQKGSYVVPPTAPARAGFFFTGWVGEAGETIYNITSNTTFNPTYAAGSKSYAGKTISVLGDSITTYSGYIPTGFAYFYPYPTADLSDVNQTWWMQFINHYGMKLLVNNAWSGSAVAGSAPSAAQGMSRLQHLLIGEVKPDVILIFMGANDAPSQYITLEQFDTAYGVMLANIKTLAPDAEIILCTLPSIPLYDATSQNDYSAVIQQYATEQRLTLIDFSKAFTRAESASYLVDSAHPNKAGMDKLAAVAIADFLASIQE